MPVHVAVYFFPADVSCKFNSTKMDQTSRLPHLPQYLFLTPQNSILIFTTIRLNIVDSVIKCSTCIHMYIACAITGIHICMGMGSIVKISVYKYNCHTTSFHPASIQQYCEDMMLTSDDLTWPGHQAMVHISNINEFYSSDYV